MIVPVEGPASETGGRVGTLVGGTGVEVDSEVGGRVVGVGIGVEVDAGAQAATRIANNIIQINRFIRFSYSERELYLFHRISERTVQSDAMLTLCSR